MYLLAACKLKTTKRYSRKIKVEGRKFIKITWWHFKVLNIQSWLFRSTEGEERWPVSGSLEMWYKNWWVFCPADVNVTQFQQHPARGLLCFKFQIVERESLALFGPLLRWTYELGQVLELKILVVQLGAQPYASKIHPRDGEIVVKNPYIKEV